MKAPPDLEAPFDRAAALPDGLQRAALTAAVGRTGSRLPDLQRWVQAWEAGRPAPADALFGDPQAVGPLHALASELDMPAACRGQATLVLACLHALLWHLDRLHDLQPRLSRAQAIAQVTDELAAQWRQQLGDWEQAQALLPGLAGGDARLWDRLRGALRSRAWHEAQRVSAQLARRPELTALIRRLGRAERATGAPQALPPPADVAPRCVGVRVVETRVPGAPGELRGIRLSDRIEGMLGSEAAMLRHPVLHKLWRARRAEARLLAYDSEAVLRDLRPDPQAPLAAVGPTSQPEARERGPILLCLDTSGSMRGAPETLAKAVALEALRTAHRERRACRLIAFGGAGECVERELALTPDGLDTLLSLMDQSFDGGTDLQAPVEQAVARVRQAGWHSADLLVVSDGEFGCVPATLDALDAARAEQGLRVQGVLVGDRETLGLLDLCDDIFWVRDWRRDGDAAQASTFSPVHSKSLTALYFPNALSARAARHHAPADDRK